MRAVLCCTDKLYIVRAPSCCHKISDVSPGALPLISTSRGFTARASAKSPLATEMRRKSAGVSRMSDLPTVTTKSLGVPSLACAPAAPPPAGMPLANNDAGSWPYLRTRLELCFGPLNAADHFNDARHGSLGYGRCRHRADGCSRRLAHRPGSGF